MGADARTVVAGKPRVLPDEPEHHHHDHHHYFAWIRRLVVVAEKAPDAQPLLGVFHSIREHGLTHTEMSRNYASDYASRRIGEII